MDDGFNSCFDLTFEKSKKSIVCFTSFDCMLYKIDQYVSAKILE